VPKARIIIKKKKKIDELLEDMKTEGLEFYSLTLAIKSVDFVKRSALNTRLSAVPCAELGSGHKAF
jgi:predicted peroxiredoxin